MMHVRSTLVSPALILVLTLCPPARAEFTDDDYAAHIEQLKEKLPGDGFTIVIEKPFVVIGDEADWVVKKRGRDTVRWAVDRLKAEYFAKDPDVILDVWLFKDKPSYDTNVKAVFGDTPTTPFGYYSRRHKALIMNIRTGGGTLVHEIVHPFVEANFPACPAWFNEGLGSLYEQCRDQRGRIWGTPNWRLASLQKAIRAESVPTFAELCSTTTGQFYYKDRGTNYAQARYLCLYLQEKGLLKKFYEQFVANHEKDPTGYETLKAVLEEDDMKAFGEKWAQWVMRLQFP
jgi:hypothetical protein